MEWLVGILADLKTLLHQIINSQQKQLSLRTEVVELREEIKYLREEVQGLKRDQLKSETFGQKAKIQTKLENDEKRIEWLTTGLQELRHEIREVSSSLNVTTLFRLSQEAENDAKSSKANMDTIQKELEKLQVAQAQTTEDVVEIKGDMADLRTKEATIATAAIGEPQIIEFRSELNQVRAIGSRRRRHDKRAVRAEVTHLETKMVGLLSLTASLDKRVRGVEMRQSTAQKLPKSPGGDTEGTDETMDKLTDLQNQMDGLKMEIGGIESLQESTQTLFKVLEGLETKYDGRMNELQERLSTLDISNNALSQSQDGLKEQQTAQWRTIRKLKTEMTNNDQRLEETHLRLTALQTHILQWGMKTCVNEVKEKAQDVRIAALEAELRGTDAI